jgi:hypothetical protein
MLTLPEELLLLSLDDHGHTHDVAPANLDAGLFAAAVYELEFRGRLAIEPSGIVVADASPTGDALLDETLRVLSTRQPGETFEALLTDLHGKGGWIRKLVLDGLAAKGELREEEGRLLWLLPQRRYSVEHGAEELSLLERIMRTLVLGEHPDRRTGALLTLMASCYASHNHLRQRMFTELEDRIYEIVNSGGEVQAIVRDSVCAALANTAPVFMP